MSDSLATSIRCVIRSFLAKPWVFKRRLGAPFTLAGSPRASPESMRLSVLGLILGEDVVAEERHESSAGTGLRFWTGRKACGQKRLVQAPQRRLLQGVLTLDEAGRCPEVGLLRVTEDTGLLALRALGEKCGLVGA